MAKQTKKQARRYVVRGVVQGVGYRWFTEKVAQLMGVEGWVRNVEDGSVEVYAVADAETLRGFAARLGEGPRYSEVREVEENEAPLLQSRGFSVRH